MSEDTNVEKSRGVDKQKITLAVFFVFFVAFVVLLVRIFPLGAESVSDISGQNPFMKGVSISVDPTKMYRTVVETFDGNNQVNGYITVFEMKDGNALVLVSPEEIKTMSQDSNEISIRGLIQEKPDGLGAALVENVAALFEVSGDESGAMIAKMPYIDARRSVTNRQNLIIAVVGIIALGALFASLYLSKQDKKNR